MVPDVWQCDCVALPSCLHPGCMVPFQGSHAEMCPGLHLHGVPAHADQHVASVEENFQTARHQDA